MLERLDETGAFFGGSMIRDSNVLRSGTGEIFTPKYCGQSVFLRYSSFEKVMPSRVTQGYKS